MKTNWLIFYVILCFCPTLLWGQGAGLQKRVSFDYRNVRLGKALKEIGKDYDVYFSYSRDFIPVGKRLTVKVEDEPLSKALEELFAPTQIVFAPIGNQIVLKVNPQKEVIKPQRREEPEFTGSLDQKPGPSAPRAYTNTSPSPIPVARRSKPIRQTPLLRTPSLEPVDWPEEFPKPDKEVLLVQPQDFESNDPYTRWGQFSIISDVGTNLGRSEDMTNKVSVNVLWGRNGGVNGVEIGGLVNFIEGDVNGLQIAGLANKVKGDVNGSSLPKKKRAKAGAQIAGITNVAASVTGCQIAGLTNRIYDGDLSGFQVAGIRNKVVGKAVGWQLAGISNYAEDNAGFQMAGLVNVAEDIEVAQIGGLVNVASEVKGIQFGLINFADTVSGVSIGLFNFVRHGYNKFEISTSESSNTDLAFRFGNRRFYNILEIGVPKDGKFSELFGNRPTWSLGYGIGTSIGKKRLTWQVEFFSKQISEDELWSEKINLISQMRLLANWQFARRFSVFVGPTINIFITEKYDTDLQEFSSQLLRESVFLDHQTLGYFPTRVQGWIGFKAGVRF